MYAAPVVSSFFVPRMTNDRLIQLYNKYGCVIFARCCKMLQDPSASEDATHEIFLRAAALLDQAPTSVDALMLIYRITTNYCLNELRRRRRHPVVVIEDDLEETDQHAEEAILNRDLVHRIIKRVPERLRAPVWLYHVDGMSHEEVGRTLGLSRRTVINYLGEFYERTRKFLGREL